MTNLRDGISKGSAAACFTDLRVCFACVQRLFGPLVTPFDCVLFSSVFYQNFTVRFLSHDNVLLHVSAQHRRP